MRFTYETGAQPLAGYTIHRGIHRGGFGEVYFAQSDGGKEVALKLIHQQDQETELRGVAQCLNLKHPNLVNLFDLKTDSHGDHWVVMEYVSGSSLDDVLASFPTGLPLGEVRDWLSGLVAGVSHLHDRGIVHRDLKPANVYRESGVVKVGDVGLSKRLDSDHRKHHTQSVGTVYYMAPEVANGKYGPEVDVYSLGIMLYEMITGRLPFTGETTAEILMKHLTAQPDLTPIPQPLRPVLARALEKDPRMRTPSARELEREFFRASGVVSEPLMIPESSFIPANGTPHSNGHTKNADPWISIRVNRPLPNRVPPPPVPKPNGGANDERRGFPKIAIFVIAILLLFGPRHPFSFVGQPRPAWLAIALIGAAFAIAKLKPLQFFNRDASGSTRNPVRTSATATPRTVRATSFVASPVSERIVPVLPTFRESLLELAKSIGSAGLMASLLSAGVYCSMDVFHRSEVMPSIEHGVLFAAVSIIGSWLLLIGRSTTMSSSWKKHQRWYARLAIGAAIGSCAYALNQFLMVNTPREAFAAHAAFSSLGSRSLIESGVDPTWLGYVVFFASWLGIRRWSRDLDPRRSKRFSIWLTVASAAIAYFVSLVFAFPQWYAVLWGGTISATVQLSSAWGLGQPSEKGR